MAGVVAEHLGIDASALKPVEVLAAAKEALDAAAPSELGANPSSPVATKGGGAVKAQIKDVAAKLHAVRMLSARRKTEMVAAKKAQVADPRQNSVAAATPPAPADAALISSSASDGSARRKAELVEKQKGGGDVPVMNEVARKAAVALARSKKALIKAKASADTRAGRSSGSTLRTVTRGRISQKVDGAMRVTAFATIDGKTETRTEAKPTFQPQPQPHPELHPERDLKLGPEPEPQPETPALTACTITGSKLIEPGFFAFSFTKYQVTYATATKPATTVAKRFSEFEDFVAQIVAADTDEGSPVRRLSQQMLTKKLTMPAKVWFKNSKAVVAEREKAFGDLLHVVLSAGSPTVQRLLRRFLQE